MEQCVMTRGTMRMPLWCADNWDSLLTVQMALTMSNYLKSIYVTGAVGVSADTFFSEGLGLALITDIGCSGSESGILNCNYSANNGNLCSTAGVVCQGIF